MPTYAMLYSAECRAALGTAGALFLGTLIVGYYYIYLFLSLFVHYCMPPVLGNYFIVTDLAELFPLQGFLAFLLAGVFCTPFWTYQLHTLVKPGTFRYEIHCFWTLAGCWLGWNVLQLCVFVQYVFPEYNFFYLETLIVPYETTLRVYYEPQLLPYVSLFLTLLTGHLGWTQLFFLAGIGLPHRGVLWGLLGAYALFFLPFNLGTLPGLIGGCLGILEGFLFTTVLRQAYGRRGQLG